MAVESAILGHLLCSRRSINFERATRTDCHTSRFVGIEPTADSNPEKFRRSLAGDVALWAPIVKAIGVKID